MLEGSGLISPAALCLLSPLSPVDVGCGLERSLDVESQQCVYVNACVRACVRMCMRACLRAYSCACARACVGACVPACLRACVSACFHACMPACLFKGGPTPLE